MRTSTAGGAIAACVDIVGTTPDPTLTVVETREDTAWFEHGGPHDLEPIHVRMKRNTIGFNGENGVLFDVSGANVTSEIDNTLDMINNMVGTNDILSEEEDIADVAALANYGNGANGVYLKTSTISLAWLHATIGNARSDQNAIAYNAENGILVEGGRSRAAIRKNTIFSDTLKGISLLDGGNAMIVKPEITRAFFNRITGTVSIDAVMVPGVDPEVSVFMDRPEEDEGPVFLGMGTLLGPDPSDPGLILWELRVPASKLLDGHIVTATKVAKITPDDTVTSEFADPFTIDVPLPTILFWKGVMNTSWAEDRNWFLEDGSPGWSPRPVDSAVIEDSPNDPVIDIGNDPELELDDEVTLANLTINAGASLDTNGFFLRIDAAGSLDVQGMLLLRRAGEPFEATTMVFGPDSRVRYLGVEADEDVIVVTAPYVNLEFENGGTLFSLSGDLGTLDEFIVVDGNVDTTADSHNVSTGTLRVDAGRLIANASTFTVNANLTFAADTFDAGESTVELGGTGFQEITANGAAFNILRVTSSPTATVNFRDALSAEKFEVPQGGSKLFFKEGVEYVLADFTLTGEEANLIQLRGLDDPAIGGLQWRLTSTTRDVRYVDVADSNHCPEDAFPCTNEAIHAFHSLARTQNNLNWVFEGPSTILLTDGDGVALGSLHRGLQNLHVTLTDDDENVDPTVAETATVTVAGSGGDSEELELVETDVNTGVFRSAEHLEFTVLDTAFAANDALLEAVTGEAITAAYADDEDTEDTSEATGTVSADIYTNSTEDDEAIATTLRRILKYYKAGDRGLFLGSLFDQANPETITVAGSNLPAMDRDFTLDDRETGAIVGAGSGATVGLEVSGAKVTIQGLQVTEFPEDNILISAGGKAVIGGSADENERNIITAAGKNGVRVDGAESDATITLNPIFDNGETGILLSNGGNDDLIAPDIKTRTGTSLFLTGVEQGNWVEVFANDPEDDDGLPDRKVQGREPIKRVQKTTPEPPTEPFEVILDEEPERDKILTATRTRDDGNPATVDPTSAFSEPFMGVAITGVVYLDEGTTPAPAGLKVSLAHLGTVVTFGVTEADGSYRIDGVPLSDDATLLVYLDDGAKKALTAVRLDGSEDRDGIDLYVDHMIVRHDVGDSITNALLDEAKGALTDPDILFTSFEGTLTVTNGMELFIAESNTYEPLGGVRASRVDLRGIYELGAFHLDVGTEGTTDGLLELVSGEFRGGTGVVDVNGTLDFSADGVYQAPTATAIAGNLVGVGANFVHNGGRVVLGGTSLQTVAAEALALADLELQNDAEFTQADNSIAGVLFIIPAKTLTVVENVDLTLAETCRVSLSDAAIAGAGTLSVIGLAVDGLPLDGTFSVETVRAVATRVEHTLPARSFGRTLLVVNEGDDDRLVKIGTTLTTGASLLVAANGAGNLALSAEANNPDVTVGGALDFVGEGDGTESLLAGTGTWRVAGMIDFTDGTLAAGMSTFELDGTSLQEVTSAGQAFNILKLTNASAEGVRFLDETIAARFEMLSGGLHAAFQEGVLHTLLDFQVKGASGNLVHLRAIGDPAPGGDQWILKTEEHGVEFVDVADSDNCPESLPCAHPTIHARQSVGPTQNNLNWAFEGAATLAFTDLDGNALAEYNRGEDTLFVTLADADQNLDPDEQEQAEIELTSASGDRDMITLLETDVNSGIFRNETAIPLTLWDGTGADDDIVESESAKILTARWVDPDDPTDTTEATATVTSTIFVNTVANEVETATTLRRFAAFHEPGDTGRFRTDIFDPDAPETISVAGTDLPALARANVVLDGSDAGVIISNGGGRSLGLHITADGVKVKGLQLEGFGQANVRVSSGASGVEIEGLILVKGGDAGLEIADSGTQATALGNFIGTATGDEDLGHAGPAVRILGGAIANLDTSSLEQGNVLAYNGSGVLVNGPTTRGLIRGNRIYRTSAGITLTAGGNQNLAKPVLNADTATVERVEGSGAQPGATIDFYHNPQAEPGPFLAFAYLGSTLAAADGTFSFDLTAQSRVTDIEAGDHVTATQSVDVDADSQLDVTSPLSDDVDLYPTAPGDLTWTGARDTDYGKPGNWDPHFVPRTVDSALIPNTVNKPVLDQDRGITNITLETGSRLDLAGHAYEVLGNFELGGSLVIGSSTLTLRGDFVSQPGASVSQGSGEVLIAGSDAQLFNGEGLTFGTVRALNATAAGVTFAGNTTFGTLLAMEPSSQLFFTAGDTFTVDVFNIKGPDAAGRAVLRSTEDDSYWFLNNRVSNDVAFVDVADSDAGLGKRILAGSTSIPSGVNPNINWSFGDDGSVAYEVDTTANTVTAGEMSLRRALLLTGAESPAKGDTVTFKEDVFPAGAPATILVEDEPLPDVAAKLTLDATDRGVVLDAGSEQTGLLIGRTGGAVTVKGMEFKGGTLAAIQVKGGAEAELESNAFFLNDGNSVRIEQPGTHAHMVSCKFGTRLDGNEDVTGDGEVDASDFGAALIAVNVRNGAHAGIGVAHAGGDEASVITRSSIGVSVNGSLSRVEFRETPIFRHTVAAVQFLAGGNGNQASPSIEEASEDTVKLLNIFPNAIVEIYRVLPEDLDFPEAQGREFLGAATAPPTQNPAQLFTVTLDEPVATGTFLTATQTVPVSDTHVPPHGRTSRFAPYHEAINPLALVVNVPNDLELVGEMSLRRALNLAIPEDPLAGEPGSRITFDPDVFPEGQETVIRVLSPLPQMDERGMALSGEGAGPVVDGGDRSIASGLAVTAGNVMIEGLTVRNFGACIEVSGTGSSATVTGSVLGSCVNGIAARSETTLTAVGNFLGVTPALGNIANLENGILLEGTEDGTAIGGLEDGEGNLFGFNKQTGVRVAQAATAALMGNFIGTNDAGANLGNGDAGTGVGLLIEGDSTAMVGPGNVLGFSPEAGAKVSGATTEAVFLGNFFGAYLPDADAPALNIGNLGDGLLILDGATVTLGGDTPEEGNVLGHNAKSGVSVKGAARLTAKGNFIGSTAAFASIGNAEHGVHAAPAAGAAALELTGNLIGANGGHGIFFDVSATSGSSADVSSLALMANLIGAGELPGDEADPDPANVANAKSGVTLKAGAAGRPQVRAAIGGALDERNAVGYNAEHGIVIQGSAASAETPKNAIFENALKGIHLLDGAHAGLTRPEVRDIDEVTVRGRLPGVMALDPSMVVEVFRDRPDKDEGRVFLGEATLIAPDAENPDVRWELSVAEEDLPTDHVVTATLTALQAGPDRITSEFSLPARIPPDVSELVWTGAVDTDYGKPGNWSLLFVPRSKDSIRIPDVPNLPVLDQDRGITDVFMEGASSLDLAGHAYEVLGNFELGGSLAIGSSTLTLGGDFVSRAGASVSQDTGEALIAGSDAQLFSGEGLTFGTVRVLNASAAGVTFAGNTTFGTLSALEAASQLFFTAGNTFTVDTFNIKGPDAAGRIVLRSTEDGTYWVLNNTGTNDVGNVDAEDSNAGPGERIQAGSTSICTHTVNWSCTDDGKESLIVDTTADTLDFTDNFTSLREALDITSRQVPPPGDEIGFDDTVFPAGAPATILVQDSPLPDVAAGLMIDASDRGVVLDAGSEQTGLLIGRTGGAVTVKGMEFKGGTLAAIQVKGGAEAELESNAFFLNDGNSVRVEESGTHAHIVSCKFGTRLDGNEDVTGDGRVDASDFGAALIAVNVRNGAHVGIGVPHAAGDEPSVITRSAFGVSVSGSLSRAEIRETPIFEHTSAAIQFLAGGNGNQPSPSIEEVSGDTVKLLNIFPNAIVEIYKVLPKDRDFPEAQGREFLGSATAPPTQQTTELFEVSLDGLPSGTLLTATQTVPVADTHVPPHGRTSRFASYFEAIDPLDLVVNVPNDLELEGEMSLRRALNLAILTSRITFDSSVFPEGQETVIRVLSPLPEMNERGMTLSGEGAGPVVDGGDRSIASGLAVTAGDVTIDQLSVRNFGACIEVSGTGSSATVTGSVLGSCANGIAARSETTLTAMGNFLGLTPALGNITNLENGILLEGTEDGTAIGGLEDGEGNLFGFNKQTGVRVAQAATAAVMGNFIGTNDAGANLGNGDGAAGVGLLVEGASTAVVGPGNVMGFSPEAGARVSGDDTTAIFLGNFFGVHVPSPASVLNVGNLGDGVQALDGTRVTFGDGTEAGANVCGFNAANGFYARKPGALSAAGNFFGIAPDGASAGNAQAGLFLDEATAMIGGLADEGNEAGKNRRGVVARGGDVDLLGNFIGVTRALDNVGNLEEGVLILAGAAGSPTAVPSVRMEANRVGSNGKDGVFLDTSSAPGLLGQALLTMKSNLVGAADLPGGEADPDPLDIGNAERGIHVKSGPLGGLTARAQVGDAEADQNSVGYNKLGGVLADGPAASVEIRQNAIFENSATLPDASPKGIILQNLANGSIPHPRTRRVSAARILGDIPAALALTPDAAIEVFRDRPGRTQGRVFLGEATLLDAVPGNPDRLWEFVPDADDFLEGHAYNATLSTGMPGSPTVTSQFSEAGPPLPDSVWTGAVSTDWDTAGNWSPAVVPDAASMVMVPDTANDPVLATPVVIAALEIKDGASLDLNEQPLEVNGELTNNGTIVASGDGQPVKAVTLTTDAAESLVAYTGLGNAADDTVTVEKGAYGILTIGSTDSEEGDSYVLAGAVDVTGSLNVEKGSLDTSSAGNFEVTVAGDVLLMGGRLRANASILHVQGDWKDETDLDGDSVVDGFEAGASQVLFEGTGTVEESRFASVMFADGAAYALASATDVTGTLTVNGLLTLQSAVASVNALGPVKLGSAGLLLQGGAVADTSNVFAVRESLAVLGSSQITLPNYLFFFSADEVDEVISIPNTVTYTVGALGFTSSAGLRGTHRVDPGTLKVSGDLLLFAPATGEVSLDTAANDATLDVGGNLIWNDAFGDSDSSGARSLLAQNTSILLAGHWDSSEPGTRTFGQSGSTVTLNNLASRQDVTSGGLAFGTLEVQNRSAQGVRFTDGLTAARLVDQVAASTLTFADGERHSIDALELTGVAASRIVLRSTAPGIQWELENTGANAVSSVDVQDSDASPGNAIRATDSVDSGDNLNWCFGACTVTWTGAVSSDWNAAGNWDPKVVPGAADSAVVPDTARDPILSTSVAIQALTVEADASLNLNGQALTVAQTLTNDGTILAHGSGTPIAAGTLTTAEVDSVIRYFGDSDGAADLITVQPGTYGTLDIAAADPLDSFSLAGITTAKGNLLVSSGSLDLADGQSVTVTVEGDVTVALAGKMLAHDAVVVAKQDFAVAAPGGFAAGASTVRLTGTGTLSVTGGLDPPAFHSLELGFTGQATTLKSDIGVEGNLAVKGGTVDEDTTPVTLQWAPSLADLLAFDAGSVVDVTTFGISATEGGLFALPTLPTLGKLLLASGVNGAVTYRTAVDTLRAADLQLLLGTMGTSLAVDLSGPLELSGSLSATSQPVLDVPGRTIEFRTSTHPVTADAMDLGTAGSDAKFVFQAGSSRITVGNVTWRRADDELQAGGSIWELSGNWDNQASTTVVPSGSTFTFLGDALQTVASGSEPWNTLKVTNDSAEGVSFLDGFDATTFDAQASGGKLTFKAGARYNLLQALILKGTDPDSAGDLLTLRSSQDDADSEAADRYEFVLDPAASQDVRFVDVKDANSGPELVEPFSGQEIQAPDSVDSGMTINWKFDFDRPVLNSAEQDRVFDPEGRTLVLTFSEDMHATPGIARVDGQDFVIAALSSEDPSVFILTYGFEIDPSTHSLTASDFKDPARNLMVPVENFPITPGDTDPPVPLAAVLDTTARPQGDGVRVIFSEAMAVATLTADHFSIPGLTVAEVAPAADRMSALVRFTTFVVLGAKITVTGTRDRSNNLQSPEPAVLDVEVDPDDDVSPTAGPAKLNLTADLLGHVVTVTASEPMKAATANDPSNYSLLETPAREPETAVLSADRLSVDLTFEEHVHKDTVLRIEGLTDLNDNPINPDPTDLAIGSDDTQPVDIVKVVLHTPAESAGDEVRVKFSDPVDPETAEESAYSIAGLTVEGVVLAPDQKSAVVALSSFVLTETQFTVSGVRDVSSNLQDPNPKTVSIGADDEDTRRPRALAAELDLTDPLGKALLVTFDEPMKADTAQVLANYSVRETPDSTETRSPVSATLSADRLSVSLGFAAAVRVGNILKVENVTDLAGNVVEPNPTELAVTSGDGDPPVPESAELDVNARPQGDGVRVKFNEAMDPRTLTADHFSIPSLTVAEVTPAPDQMSALARFTTFVPLGVKITVSNTRDVSSNLQDPPSVELTVTEDPGDDVRPTAGPAKLNLTANPLGHVVTVTASEPMKAVTANDVSNYSLLETPAREPETAVLSADRLSVDLTFEEHVHKDTVLRIEGLTDLNDNPINPDPTDLAIGSDDAAKPIATGAFLDTSLGSNDEVVRFELDEAMDPEPLHVAENYSIAELTVVDIEMAGDQKSVKVRFSDEIDIGTSATVRDLADVSSNLIDPTTLTVREDPTVPAKVLEARRNTGEAGNPDSEDGKLVDVTFDKTLVETSAETLANYQLKNGSGDPRPIAAELLAGGKGVRLTFDVTVKAKVGDGPEKDKLHVENIMDSTGHVVESGDHVIVGENLAPRVDPNAAFRLGTGAVVDQDYVVQAVDDGNEDAEFPVTFLATDLDGDTLTYAIRHQRPGETLVRDGVPDLPGADCSFDPSLGELKCKFSSGFKPVGEFTFIFEASDGEEDVDEDLIVEVLDRTAPPSAEGLQVACNDDPPGTRRFGVECGVPQRQIGLRHAVIEWRIPVDESDIDGNPLRNPCAGDPPDETSETPFGCGHDVRIAGRFGTIVSDDFSVERDADDIEFFPNIPDPGTPPLRKWARFKVDRVVFDYCLEFPGRCGTPNGHYTNACGDPEFDCRTVPAGGVCIVKECLNTNTTYIAKVASGDSADPRNLSAFAEVEFKTKSGGTGPGGDFSGGHGGSEGGGDDDDDHGGGGGP